MAIDPATDCATKCLEALVGSPYSLGNGDPDSGFDCLSLLVYGYELIGEALGDVDRWRCPLPSGYPYPSKPIDDTSDWMPPDDVDEFSRHWRRISQPAFAAVVRLGRNHVGMIPDAAPPFRVLHAHRKMGVVLQPLSRMKSVLGYYELRRRPQ